MCVCALRRIVAEPALRRAVVRLLAGTLAAGLLAGGAQAIERLDMDVAVLRVLNKTTARIETLRAPRDAMVAFGTLTMTVRACRKNPPEERPEAVAFLEIDDQPPGAEGRHQVFSGWMFASSPALSALDHAGYDVWVIDCSTSPAESAAYSAAITAS